MFDWDWRKYQTPGMTPMMPMTIPDQPLSPVASPSLASNPIPMAGQPTFVQGEGIPTPTLPGERDFATTSGTRPAVVATQNPLDPMARPVQSPLGPPETAAVPNTTGMGLLSSGFGDEQRQEAEKRVMKSGEKDSWDDKFRRALDNKDVNGGLAALAKAMGAGKEPPGPSRVSGAQATSRWSQDLSGKAAQMMGARKKKLGGDEDERKKKRRQQDRYSMLEKGM
jgi:hypothetical protein